MVRQEVRKSQDGSTKFRFSRGSWYQTFRKNWKGEIDTISNSCMQKIRQSFPWILFRLDQRVSVNHDKWKLHLVRCPLTLAQATLSLRYLLWKSWDGAQTQDWVQLLNWNMLLLQKLPHTSHYSAVQSQCWHEQNQMHLSERRATRRPSSSESDWERIR